MLFSEFEIDQRCLKVLDSMGIVEPTPVQEGAIPIAVQGTDLVAIAQTGTGKTLAFALPALTRLASGKPERNSVLVLVPTRELCVQVQSVIEEVGKPLGIRSTTIYGGVSLERQRDELKKGVHVIVATPGRLLDHMGRRNIRFNNLEILVLDEADRMLDMGFLPDIQRILDQIPSDRQTLMFSATFPKSISHLTSRMMRDPERIEIGAIARPVDSVRQLLYPVHQHEKPRILTRLLEKEQPESMMIFLRTKDRTEQLGQMLKKKGFKIALIHGDRSQAQRQIALDGFRKGKYDILVATDVAARGLDIDGVSHVVNYDIPPNPDDYIHRIGRTARAHAEGDAITFVTPAEFQSLGAIERALDQNLPREEYENAPRVISVFHPKGSKLAKKRQRRGRRLHRR